MAYRLFILPDDFCEFPRLSPRLDPRWLVVVTIPLLFAGCGMGTLQSVPGCLHRGLSTRTLLASNKFAVRKGKARQNRVDGEARHIAAQCLFINQEERKKARASCLPMGLGHNHDLTTISQIAWV